MSYILKSIGPDREMITTIANIGPIQIKVEQYVLCIVKHKNLMTIRHSGHK